MTRRFQQRSTPAENVGIILRSIPWKLLLLIPLLILVAIPAFYYGTHAGQKAFPSLINYFYNLTGPPPTAVPTPQPSLPTTLPVFGSLLYTVQGGDSCDEILTVQMHMADASTIFSDAKPDTVKALDASLGQDCHALQPGMVLTLSPQYPLIAFGGRILKVEAISPQQVLPTPLINITPQQQLGVDCSNGCLLNVLISSGIQVNLSVQTTLPVKLLKTSTTIPMLILSLPSMACPCVPATCKSTARTTTTLSPVTSFLPTLSMTTAELGSSALPALTLSITGDILSTCLPVRACSSGSRLIRMVT